MSGVEGTTSVERVNYMQKLSTCQAHFGLPLQLYSGKVSLNNKGELINSKNSNIM